MIERRRWDKCISESFNGLIYAYSWYLDIISPNWQAIVTEDYSIVMPLTHRKKHGINYLAQHFSAQQLGVFSSYRLDEEIIEAFFHQIPKKYRWIDIQVNSFNPINLPDIESKERITYLLDLIQPYEALRKNFSTNTIRNIKKAKKHKINVSQTVTPNDLIRLLQENEEKLGLKEEDYNTIRKIIVGGLQRGMGKIYGAYTAENILCASAYFATSNQRTMYLFASSSALGIEKNAMFALIDQFIQDNAQMNMTLDFEGSMHEGVARFYRGFGGQASTYWNIKKNTLPWLLKLVKN
jgi:TM2 domain-containing membrane protein YozV